MPSLSAVAVVSMASGALYSTVEWGPSASGLWRLGVPVILVLETTDTATLLGTVATDAIAAAQARDRLRYTLRIFPFLKAAEASDLTLSVYTSIRDGVALT
jgi:hypothetical protein